MRALIFLLASALALGACMDPVDPAWQLDHDHVIAVRATPPSLAPGETARLDALVAHAGAATTLELPAEAAALKAPEAYRAFVWFDGSAWQVTLPADFAAAAPVPLDVYMAFPRADGDPLYAKKTVWLGAHADNPVLPEGRLDGAPMTDALRVPVQTDVYLSVDVAAGWRVNWLSSVGTLFQDDVATSFLRVAPDDAPLAGELAVVVRDPAGGVAWRVWPVAADASR